MCVWGGSNIGLSGLEKYCIRGRAIKVYKITDGVETVDGEKFPLKLKGGKFRTDFFFKSVSSHSR